jgi:hypothetical protein
MKRKALEELEARQMAAFLIREGGVPETVATMTGTPVHFARRLASDYRCPVRFVRSETPFARLWATRSRVLQTSLFGMCLHRLRWSHGEPMRMASIVDALGLFKMLCRPTIGYRRESFSAHEAMLFYDVYVQGHVACVVCARCHSAVWVMKDKAMRFCPNCRGSMRPVLQTSEG